VPKYTEDTLALGQVVSTLGKALLDGFVEYAKQNDVKLEGLPEDPEADIPTDQLLTVVRSALAMFFPLLAPTSPG
jgi:hypothetical protein